MNSINPGDLVTIDSKRFYWPINDSFNQIGYNAIAFVVTALEQSNTIQQIYIFDHTICGWLRTNGTDDDVKIISQG